MTGALNLVNPVITIPIILDKYTIGKNFLIGGTIKKKERRKDFDFNSSEANAFINRGQVSDRLFKDIIKMSKGDKLVQLLFVSKGIETNQWIRFAIYYMTDPLASQILFADIESRELVNGITNLAGFGKVYESENIADLDQYDSNKLGFNYNGRFLLNKSELVDFLSTPHFQAVMASKIFRRQQMLNKAKAINEPKYLEGEVIDVIPKEEQTYANPVFELLKNEKQSKPLFTIDNPDAVLPIEFGTKEKAIVPKKGQYVPTDVYDRFEKIFRNFIPETVDYHYENINGFYHLYITRPDTGVEEFYILDDGSIMGGKNVSILANYLTNEGERAMFVDVKKHPAIASRVLERCLFNYLTAEEVEECKKDHLYYTRLYNIFDFQNTEFYDDMDDTEKYNFEVTLLGIESIEYLRGVRLKFAEYTDPNHMTLVSNFSLRKPLRYIQTEIVPETFVADGLVITVENNIIDVSYQGEVKRFRMGNNV